MNAVKADNPVEAHPSASKATGGEAAMRITLPTGLLLICVVAGTVLAATVSVVIALVGGLESDAMMGGVVGAVAVGIVALAGVFIMTPWKSRPIADWMTFWLGATVFRLLVTPVVVYLLYSAASSELAVKPLVLSVASTYLVTLMAEAAILASHVRRSFPSA